MNHMLSFLNHTDVYFYFVALFLTVTVRLPAVSVSSALRAAAGDSSDNRSALSRPLIGRISSVVAPGTAPGGGGGGGGGDRAGTMWVGRCHTGLSSCGERRTPLRPRLGAHMGRSRLAPRWVLTVAHDAAHTETQPGARRGPVPPRREAGRTHTRRAGRPHQSQWCTDESLWEVRAALERPEARQAFLRPVIINHLLIYPVVLRRSMLGSGTSTPADCIVCTAGLLSALSIGLIPASRMIYSFPPTLASLYSRGHTPQRRFLPRLVRARDYAGLATMSGCPCPLSPPPPPSRRRGSPALSAVHQLGGRFLELLCPPDWAAAVQSYLSVEKQPAPIALTQPMIQNRRLQSAVSCG